MEHFIVYHSDQRMGYDYEPSGELVFLSKKLSLLTKAIGNTVWVIQGSPNQGKTAYTLRGAYVADCIETENGRVIYPNVSDTEPWPFPVNKAIFVIRGTNGTDFIPPIELNRFAWFSSLLKSQSNFSLGFNRLSDESIILALSALQAENSKPSFSPTLPDIDLTISVSEGGRRLVSHLKRERKRAVVEAKKTAVLNSKGSLSCEVCGFDFSSTYGSLGEGFCEVHHLSPLSAFNESVTTTLTDLAVLCSNCHRIIHRSDPMLSVAELSMVVRNGHP